MSINAVTCLDIFWFVLIGVTVFNSNPNILSYNEKKLPNFSEWTCNQNSKQNSSSIDYNYMKFPCFIFYESNKTRDNSDLSILTLIRLI